MQDNWLQHPEIHQRETGHRPSFIRAMEIIDTNDPALAQIGAALREAQEAGADLSDETVAEAVRVGRLRWAAIEEPQEPTERIAAAFPSIVYYLLRGPLVKIGTTRQPERRFITLVPDKILAVEPGDRADERRRHVQFKHLRQGTSEYFRQADDLMRHIAEVRERHGAPDPSWPTVENLDRQRIDFHYEAPPAKSAEVATVTEGARRLGVPKNTISGWIYRKRLHPVGKGEHGRPVYFLDDMRYLADRSIAMTEARVIRPR